MYSSGIEIVSEAFSGIMVMQVMSLLIPSLKRSSGGLDDIRHRTVVLADEQGMVEDR